jgi:SEC-C motif
MDGNDLAHVDGEDAGFEVERGLLQLPGAPEEWIWAFTCEVPRCSCRTAIVLFARGDRATLLELGRPVAETWRAGEDYGVAASELSEVISFAIDLDTLELSTALDDQLLDEDVPPDIRAIAAKLDDDLLDEIARIWHLGKGDPPPDLAAAPSTFVLPGWAPGQLVSWDAVHPVLRVDPYVIGDRVFEAVELYCVEADCPCSKVHVEIRAVVPQGASHPGRVELDGTDVTLHPTYERQRERLTELWRAYCERHPRYQERLARRSAAMHGFAGRIAAPPPAPKVSRNAPCPCGSGKKFKLCCGAG